MLIRQVQSENVSQEDEVSRHASSQQINFEATAGELQAASVRRSRVPRFMKGTLKDSNMLKSSEHKYRRGMSLKQASQGGIKKTSKIGSLLSSKIKGLMGRVQCEICEEEMKRCDSMPHISECQHRFNFCQSCLHHYVIYKVTNFEEVYCPREGCEHTLDMKGEFFHQLPRDIQRKYPKVHRFNITMKDPDTKLCPKNDCEGFIKPHQNHMKCTHCDSRFCPSCLLALHKGPCDRRQLEFFEKNLKYRQCKKCHFMIEKNRGCNHMRCRCGYQFCYVCGDKWSSPHYGRHDANGRLPKASGQRQQDQACCDCTCLNQGCGPVVSGIIKFPFQLVLTLLYFACMLVFFSLRDLIVYVMIGVASVVVGIFAYPFNFMCENKGVIVALAIIFLPVTMLVGIVDTAQELYCDIGGTFCQQIGESCGESLTGIWTM